MVSPIGVNVTVHNNMDHCCPRKIRILGCCCSLDEESIKKTDDTAKETFDTTTDDDDDLSPEFENSVEKK